MTSRKHHCLIKNSWSAAKYSVALKSPQLKYILIYIFVFLSLCFCASIFPVCLFSTHTDTVFQTAPSSKTSNPTLFSVRIKEKKKYTHFHLNIHQRQPHKTQTKKKKAQKKAQTFRRANRRRQGTKVERTHTHTSPRHTAHTDRQTHKETANTKHSTARSLFYAEIF